MQSGTEDQTPNYAGKSAEVIGKNLQDGANIMDFVAKNTPGYQDPANPASQEIQQDVDKMAAEREPIPAEPVSEPSEQVVPDIMNTEEPAPHVEEEPEENTQQSAADESAEDSQEDSSEDSSEEEGVELKGNAAENFKNLRSKLKAITEESTDKDKLLQELSSELEKFSKGEKLPEELVKREERIAELEHYEKLHNLKGSRYYQDNFVKPLEGIRGKLEKMAKDYELDPGTLIQAVNNPSEASLNQFLSRHFDVVGATEVKGIVKDYRDLQSRAQEAEKEPEEALNHMIEAAEGIRQNQQKERLEFMQDVSRSAWREALDYVKEEGKIRELMYEEGNQEHNEKVFTPIVKAAAGEYGKLVNQLVKNGLESLPKDLARSLSRMCQLAHASAVSIHSRERAVQMAEEIEQNAHRTQKYVRPSMSGKMVPGQNGSGAGKGPSSPMEAAQAILNRVKGS